MSDTPSPRVVIPTGYKISDLRNTRLRRALSNIRRLQVVVDFMLGGNETLSAKENRGAGHLDSALTMSQRLSRSGDLEARTFYVPCLSYMELNVRQAVRQLLWRREADRTRSFRRSIVHPDVKEEVYRVFPEHLALIDGACTRLEPAVESLSVQMGSIHFEAELNVSQETSDGDYSVAEDPIFVRWISFGASPASVDLRFLSPEMPSDFNAAWDGLWEALGACLQPAFALPDARINYPLSIKKYSRLLADAWRSR